jgi:hypothetical protein
MALEPDDRPKHDVRYKITDREAREFLDRLATEGDELRDQLEANPREVLLEHHIDVDGIPDKISLPPAAEIETFINNHLRGKPDKSNNIGYAILYWMLGAMPLVVADRDAAP